MALRKMIAYEELPEQCTRTMVHNFVVAEKELRDCLSHWNQQKVHESLLHIGIDWHFNPQKHLTLVEFGNPYFSRINGHLEVLYCT